MKMLSLFANIGVSEAYLSSAGVEVVLANEFITRRAELYSHIYPNTEMICGDINHNEIYSDIIKKSQSLGIDIIMATPPCQGISRAGKQDENDKRNLLILPVVRMVKELQPKYVFIENVPQFTETIIIVDNKTVNVSEYIIGQLEEQYYISFNLIDTKYFSVPQTRQRAIILLTRKDIDKHWIIPNHDDRFVTLEDVIGDLPSIDPFISDVHEKELLQIFPQYYSKAKEAAIVSKWHRPPTHIKRQVITMMHTPTGKTAFDNDKYIPIKTDGTPVTGYKSTYRRLRWNTPASTITMDNRKISSQNNVHPGRFICNDSSGDVIFSDARALSLFEIMRVMSLPDDWPLPHNVNESFVRSIIGEGIPPLFVKKVFDVILKSEVEHV